MKKIILLLLALVGFMPFSLGAPIVKSIVLFDIATMTDSTVYDTLIALYTMPPKGAMSYQIVFEGLDCIDAEYNAGEGNIKTADSYPSTVGGWTMPIVLDSTAVDSDGDLQFSKYRSDGIADWNYWIEWPNWEAQYLFHNLDPGSCTAGTLTRYILIKPKK